MIVLEKDINCLKLENSILQKFYKNNILLIKDLWILNKNDLKKIGLNCIEIKKIVVKLQLFGIDLNKKKY